MREVLSMPQPPGKQSRTNTAWRSRDAANRLFKALQDPHMRPRWVEEIKLPEHVRNKHPSVLVVCRDATYGIKALRNDIIAKQYRRDHPDSKAIEIVILPEEPLSSIRTRVYGMLSSIRHKSRRR